MRVNSAWHGIGVASHALADAGYLSDELFKERTINGIAEVSVQQYGGNRWA